MAAARLPDDVDVILAAMPEALAVVDMTDGTMAAVRAANALFLDLVGTAGDALAAHMRGAEASAFLAYLEQSSHATAPAEPIETTLHEGGRARRIRWRARCTTLGGVRLLLLSAVLRPFWNEARRPFRELIDSSCALIAFIDREGRYEFVNHALAALLGETAESLIGRLASAADAGSPYMINADALVQALGGQPAIFQSEIQARDGRVLVFENHYQPRQGEIGNDGVFVIAFDVSDRVEAANALKASEERFRKLVELVPYGIARTDCTGSLRLSNPAHDAMLGYEPGELDGRNIWEIFADEEREVQRETFFRIIRERPRPSPIISRCLRKDGRLIDVQIDWCYEYDDNGAVSGFISVLTDVTSDLHDKRELQMAKDAAEHATIEKSRFLAAASHDLQQPLHSLSIMLGLLANQKDEQRRNEIIAMMERAVEGARGLLRVVLDISKLEAGVVVPRIEAFPIAAIYEDIEAELKPLTEGRPLDFRIVGSAAEIISDRRLLKSILHNLVANAIRYTPRGKVLVGARRLGDRLRLQVWDTGLGIPEDRIKDIFMEFTRLQKGADEGQTQALGLGLSIVERSCALLDHKLAIRSEVGRGSVFSVDVPLAARRGQGPEASRVAQAVGPCCERRGLVLLIEDNPAAALATRQLIEDWGNRCLVALSSAEALALVRNAGQQPDLLVADYNLGECENGLLVLDRIFAILGRKIPAILMTANDSAECRDAARTHDIPVMQKPANPARLRALMSYCLARNILDEA